MCLPVSSVCHCFRPSHMAGAIFWAKCKWCGNWLIWHKPALCWLEFRAHPMIGGDVWLSPPLTVPVKMRSRCSTVESWQGCRKARMQSECVTLNWLNSVFRAFTGSWIFGREEKVDITSEFSQRKLQTDCLSPWFPCWAFGPNFKLGLGAGGVNHTSLSAVQSSQWRCGSF